MFISVDHQKIYIVSPELLVSRTRRVYIAEYIFSSDWDDYDIKTAVFKREDGQIYETEIRPEYDGHVEIPWEALANTGKIRLGVYGYDSTHDAHYPTIWSDPYYVPEGCSLGASSDPSETLIGRLINAAEAAQEIAQGVRNDADAGVFDGKDGTDGKDGKDGEDGSDGLSAYEIAVYHGYEGTEEQWLATLKGDTGATGPAGPQGPAGQDYVLTAEDMAEIVDAVVEEIGSADTAAY